MTTIDKGYLVQLEDTESFVGVNIHAFTDGQFCEDGLAMVCRTPAPIFGTILTKPTVDTKNPVAMTTLMAKRAVEVKRGFSLQPCTDITAVVDHLRSRLRELGVDVMNVDNYVSLIQDGIWQAEGGPQNN